MRVAIEPLPQLADRRVRGRVRQIRREIGERPEHERPLQQIRPRQMQARLVVHQIAIEQHVEVH